MLRPRYDIIKKMQKYLYLYFEQDESIQCYHCAHCDNFLVAGHPILKDKFDSKYVSSCKLYRLPDENCPKYYNGCEFAKLYSCYNEWFYEDENGLKEGLFDEND